MSPTAPPEADEAAPFWQATRSKTLILPWCVACERPHWYPRVACPSCLGTELAWRPSSGDGIVHAVSVHHRPGMGRTAEDCPYAVALVDLVDGVRMMANVVDCDPADVRVGDPVRIAWRPLEDGRHLVAFAPRAS